MTDRNIWLNPTRDGESYEDLYYTGLNCESYVLLEYRGDLVLDVIPVLMGEKWKGERVFFRCPRSWVVV